MDREEFRQWAMIYAMQGILANPTTDTYKIEAVAKVAVLMADALLEANTIDEVPSETP